MGKQRLSFGNLEGEVDFGRYTDLSLPVNPGGVTAWGIARASIHPHRSGSFTGSILEGASVNFNDIEFNPHAHGTHTESVGHILPEGRELLQSPPPPWMLARLHTALPEATPGGFAVLPDSLPDDLGLHGVTALILRTQEPSEDARNRDWSGSNPPFLHAGTAAKIAAAGIGHLLVDLPSVDPEADGGALAAHRAFWGLPGPPRQDATITELIQVPSEVPDGLYLLNLQLGGFTNDACPSRPLIFPFSTG